MRYQKDDHALDESENRISAAGRIDEEGRSCDAWCGGTIQGGKGVVDVH